jgi:SAM-dependent methyltransferase
MAPRPCPACGGARDLDLVEERRDPIGGVLYRLYRCGTCGLVFSEPRDPMSQEWYEKAAPLRVQELRAAPKSDWRFRRFLDAGLAPGKLLDVGCGGGGFLALAAERGWKGVGVDHHESALALARERGLDVYAQDFGPFLKGRAAKEFDAVALFDVLEHAPEPRELLAAIKPVLKRGGHLVVTFPNDSRPGLFGREEFDYPPHHFTRWTAGALRSFLEDAGFTVVRLDSVGPSALWFSEEIFSAWIAPPLVRLARRVLFGKKAEGTLSQLYASAPGSSSGLADKSRRQKLVDAFKYACRVVTAPMGLVLALIYRVFRRDSGEYLYCLARYDA